MAFGRRAMRGIRRRMAQERATRRNQQKRIANPLRPIKPARHSGQLKGGRGGIPAVPRRGPQPIVDPLSPIKPAGAKHSGQGRGGRGGIPDVKAPRPYFKGGNVAPTKNAVGANDYRKTGTTLSVKDNRKKTK